MAPERSPLRGEPIVLATLGHASQRPTRRNIHTHTHSDSHACVLVNTVLEVKQPVLNTKGPERAFFFFVCMGWRANSDFSAVRFHPVVGSSQADRGVSQPRAKILEEYYPRCYTRGINSEMPSVLDNVRNDKKLS